MNSMQNIFQRTDHGWTIQIQTHTTVVTNTTTAQSLMMPCHNTNKLQNSPFIHDSSFFARFERNGTPALLKANDTPVGSK